MRRSISFCAVAFACVAACYDCPSTCTSDLPAVHVHSQTHCIASIVVSSDCEVVSTCADATITPRQLDAHPDAAQSCEVHLTLDDGTAISTSISFIDNGCCHFTAEPRALDL
jgi:hypothetical protein